MLASPLLLLLCALTGSLAWSPTTGHHLCPQSQAPRARASLLRAQAEGVGNAGSAVATATPEEEVGVPVDGAATPLVGGVVTPTPEVKTRVINQQLMQAADSTTILELTETFLTAGSDHAVEMEPIHAVNLATALHRLAVINKRQRARRDAVLRDRRFELLIDAIAGHVSDFNARAVADVLWSFATLQHWPPTLLKPLLTGVSVQLEADAFEPQHLSTMAWALAKLECKPVRLLERIEQQSIPRLDAMNTQNVANLLWGLSKLNYQPTALLPPLSAVLVAPGALDSAKPVEVADIAFALGLIGKVGAHEDLLLALASRAAPDVGLSAFTSRQLVILIWAFARLKAASRLPEGLLDEWVGAVRTAHESTPLLEKDARNLERALSALGIDATWIKQSEMLYTWSVLASGGSGRASREYTDEELRSTFDAIDTDGSGDIDLSELTTAIQAISPDTDSATVRKMLELADADGDLEVSFDEFKDIFRSLLRASRSSA